MDAKAATEYRKYSLWPWKLAFQIFRPKTKGLSHLSYAGRDPFPLIYTIRATLGMLVWFILRGVLHAPSWKGPVSPGLWLKWLDPYWLLAIMIIIVSLFLALATVPERRLATLKSLWTPIWIAAYILAIGLLSYMFMPKVAPAFLAGQLPSSTAGRAAYLTLCLPGTWAGLFVATSIYIIFYYSFRCIDGHLMLTPIVYGIVPWLAIIADAVLKGPPRYVFGLSLHGPLAFALNFGGPVSLTVVAGAEMWFVTHQLHVSIRSGSVPTPGTYQGLHK